MVVAQMHVEELWTWRIAFIDHNIMISISQATSHEA
jgi:hypothetical protein